MGAILSWKEKIGAKETKTSQSHLENILFDSKRLNLVENEPKWKYPQATIRDFTWWSPLYLAEFESVSLCSIRSVDVLFHVRLCQQKDDSTGGASFITLGIDVRMDGVSCKRSGCRSCTE